MMNKQSPSQQSKQAMASKAKDRDSLRGRAEARVQRLSKNLSESSGDEAQSAIHELQVHQVELEMQNEELRQTQLDLAHSRDQFSELYDFAPVGYVTLDRNGIIVQANLTAASMWYTERQKLIGTRKLSDFIAPESQDTYFHHFRNAFSQENPAGNVQACQITMKPTYGRAGIEVRLESVIQMLAGSDTAHCLTALVDISKTVKARREARKSQERLSKVLEGISDCFLAMDRDWRCTFANDAAADFLRTTRQQLLGNVLWHVAPHLVDSLLYTEMHRAVVRQEEIVFEHHLPADGRWHQYRIHPSDDGVSVYFVDTTDRKQMEQALRESEQKLRIALECGRMGTWYWNLKTDQCDWDHRESQLLGIDPVSTRKTGDIFFQCIHPEDVERMRALIGWCIEEDVEYESEFRILHPDGVVRWVAGQGKVLRNQHGEPEHMVGINFDVTQRKQAEQKLKQIKDELTDFVDNATIGMHWVAASGEIIWANRHELEMLGYQEEEYVGRHIAEFHADQDTIQDILERLANFEEVQDREARLRCKDGTIKHVLIDSNVYRENGRLIHTRCFMRDVTKRMQAQQALEKLSEELERKVEERSATIKLLHDIATRLHTTDTVEEAIAFVLREFARFQGMCFGQAFRTADDDSNELMPFLEYYEDIGGRFDAFRRATSRFRFHRNRGFPGHVLASGKPQIINRQLGRKLPLRRLEFAEAGIKSVIGFPVLVGEKVVAVLEFLSDEMMESDDRLFEAMVTIGSQLGRVIERKRLEKQIADTTSREQQRIGQELHDTVIQQLSGGTMIAESLRQRAETGAPLDADSVAELVQVLKDAQLQIRRLHRGLMPVEVDAAGLMSALEGLAKRTEKMYGVACRYDNRHRVLLHDNTAATHLFRIAQEAVHNAVKHAGAKSVTIELARDDERLIRLSVLDDGCGFASGVDHEGSGIRIMRYRAGVLNGRFEIDSTPDQGTTVTCIVPSGSEPRYDA